MYELCRRNKNGLKQGFSASKSSVSKVEFAKGLKRTARNSLVTTTKGLIAVQLGAPLPEALTYAHRNHNAKQNLCAIS